MTKRRSLFEEDVRGTVIGPITVPYEFWITGVDVTDKKYRPYPVTFTSFPFGNVFIARGHFENDDEAIAWVRENHPVEFKWGQGLEMRVFDVQEKSEER